MVSNSFAIAANFVCVNDPEVGEMMRKNTILYGHTAYCYHRYYMFVLVRTMQYPWHCFVTYCRNFENHYVA